ncbi:hypothetical protein C0J52_13502 [Blattella germanica]|nr:hypothetical protein C0J52_13502 [Blattella germanica]
MYNKNMLLSNAESLAMKPLAVKFSSTFLHLFHTKRCSSVILSLLHSGQFGSSRIRILFKCLPNVCNQSGSCHSCFVGCL